MVMTSDMIAAQAAAFQQQTMGSMQHAGMISQLAGAPMGQQMGENMMGRAVNTASAYGAPVLSGAMSLAGLDPFSMGIRGAMMGGARFGAMGALGGGLMGAGLVGAPLMAAQYAGTQMLQGMSQQQQLNSVLRENYQFMGTQGQQGFTTGGMRDIGQMMRQMSMQRGPGGEFSSMNELTALAGRMGQMGMMSGVRDVSEFSDKFRQMVSTVKEVATAMSTNLEQALNVVNSMKQSGIFRNQGQVAQEVRNIAMAGGLAMEEVTSMMNVGSQISRSIGGRGRAGATAGMKAIGQIGTAIQMGTLTEEDIYNVTGLTGAAGRAAMAERQLGQSAQFLSGSLGRRFLAAAAGRNGQLDAASAEELMYGGTGTGRTMEMAYGNLGRVGQANFLRNEGRLRGEMMAQFGGLAAPIAAKGWLEQRGFDLTTGNDDRAAIFLQRRFNMSPDDVDTLLKQVRDLPFNLARQNDAAEENKSMQNVERYRQNTGLRGVKKKLEDFRVKVQGTLQQAGADFYSSGSEMINRFVNRLTGDFEVQVERDLGPKIRDAFGATSQGTYGAYMREAHFGITKDWQVKGMGTGGAAAMAGIFGGGGPTNVQAFKRSGDLERFRAAGWNLNVSSDKNLAASLTNIEDIQRGFQQGYGGPGAEQLRAFGQENTVAIQEAMLNERRIYQGQRGLEQMSRIIDQTAGGSSALSYMYGTANDKTRAELAGTYLRGAGMGKTAAFMGGAPERLSIFNMSQFATAGERQEALGGYMYGAHIGGAANITPAQKAVAERRELGGQVGGGLLAGLLGVIPGVGVATSAYDVAQAATGGQTIGQSLIARGGRAGRESGIAAAGGRAVTQQVGAAAARFMESEKGMEMVSLALNTDKDTAAAFQAQQLQAMEALRVSKEGQGAAGYGAESKLSDEKQGEYLARQSAYLTSKFGQWKQTLGHEPSSEELDQFARDNSNFVADKADLIRQVGGFAAQAHERGRRNRLEAYRRTKQQGQEFLGTMGGMFRTSEAGGIRSGRLTAEGLTAFQGIGGMSKAGSAEMGWSAGGASKGQGESMADFEKRAADTEISGGARFMALMGQAATVRAGIAEGIDSPENLAKMRDATGKEALAWETFGGMSISDQQKMAATARQKGFTNLGREMHTRTGMKRRLERAKAGGALGTAKEVASQLGVELSTEELAGGDPEAVANALTGQMGFKDQKQADAFRQQAKRILSGGSKDAVGELRALQSTAGEQQREKRKEAAREEDPNHEVLTGIADAIKAQKAAIEATKGNTQSAATSLNSGITVYDGGERGG